MRSGLAIARLASAAWVGAALGIGMANRRRMNRLLVTLVAGLCVTPVLVVLASEPGKTSKSPGTRQPAGAPVATLSGRVTDESDKPLSDVRVEVDVTDPGANTRPLVTKSTANGDYRLEIPRLTGFNLLSIIATRPGHRRLIRVSSGLAGDPLVLTAGAQLKVNLFLHAGLYFAGIVVDEQGKPISGVRVAADAVTRSGRKLELERAETKQDGSFELFDFSEKPAKVEGESSQGQVSFSHRDYVPTAIPDVFALTPPQRTALRIVLKHGRLVSGVVLDAANNSHPLIRVRAIAPDGSCLKAVFTNDLGKFQIRGLPDGPLTLTVVSGEIKQSARVPLTLTRDRKDLKISLQPIPLPKDLKTCRVLGMQLADVTPELRFAYDLPAERGVLVLECGNRSDPFQQAGEISPGCLLQVEMGHADSVRDMIKSVLSLTANEKPDNRLVVITHNERHTADADALDSTTFKVTDADLEELQEAANQCAADDQEAILALAKLGAQLRFKAVNAETLRSDGPEIEMIILGDKWKGSDRDLRLAWFMPVHHVFVRGRGRVSDQALDELRKRRPEINVDRVSEAYLGVEFVPEKSTLQVAGVRSNSAGARAGFETKDVLIEFAGKPVPDFRTLRAVTFTLKPGQKVGAKLIRNGKPVNVAVEMGGWD
jgi:hypothetical protein